MQNNRKLSFSSCIHKLHAAWGCWYCGPSNTRVGKAARAICFSSTVFMVISGTFYLPYYFAATHLGHDRAKHNTYLSFFANCSTILLCFGLSGYFMTPIIGHGFCGIIDTTRRDQTDDVGQEEGYELPSSTAALPSYEEIFFGEDPPSYEEALAVATQLCNKQLILL